MAATVTGNVEIRSEGTYTADTGFTRNRLQQVPLNLRAVFTSGTAADQVAKVGTTSLSLTASTPQTIDLTTALVDPDGAAVSFARITALVFVVTCITDGASVTVAADATNGFSNFVSTGGFKIPASTDTNSSGAVFIAPNTTAYAVTGSNKRIQFTPSAHAITVDILALGS